MPVASRFRLIAGLSVWRNCPASALESNAGAGAKEGAGGEGEAGRLSIGTGECRRMLFGSGLRREGCFFDTFDNDLDLAVGSGFDACAALAGTRRLAKADDVEPFPAQAQLVQLVRHRVGALFGQALVVRQPASGIGMADHTDGPQSCSTRFLGDPIEDLHGRGPNLGAVRVEIHHD